MTTPSKADGRNVWDIATRITALTNKQFDTLTEPLGSTDPVRYQAAMKEALRLNADIKHLSVEIYRICELAAKRGEYGEGE